MNRWAQIGAKQVTLGAICFVVAAAATIFYFEQLSPQARHQSQLALGSLPSVIGGFGGGAFGIFFHRFWTIVALGALIPATIVAAIGIVTTAVG